MRDVTEYNPVLEVHSIIGTVTSMEDLLTATTDVTTVFHLASVTDSQMFPDYDILKMVNIDGQCVCVWGGEWWCGCGGGGGGGVCV